MLSENILYNLWYVRSYDNREDTELYIGLYESHKEAEDVATSLKELPGFKDAPECFEIHDVKVGRTNWQHGFITHYGPPPKDALAEAFDVPAWSKSEFVN